MSRGTKQFSFVVIAATLLVVAASPGKAAYPERQVNLVVGYAPGGGTDLLARVIAQKLSEKWKQPVVVENREGADGSIAAGFVAHSAPDGYTISMVSNNLSIPAQGYKPNYDPIKSFIPLSETAYVPDLFVVNSSFPAQTLQEFIAQAKAKPNTLNFASVGAGTGPFLEMALFMQRAGFTMTNVSYKGSAASLVAVMSGEVSASFSSVPSTVPQVQAGKVRALAVSSKARISSLPQVPTLAEAAELPDYEASVWYGMVTPAGTPEAVASKLEADIRSVTSLPEVQSVLAERGFQSVNSSSKDFANLISSDYAKWSEVLKSLPTK